jgi:hypothetical protein
MNHTNNKQTSELLKKLVLTCLILLVSACMPRGETITLDQSLDLAKERYANALTVSKDKLSPQILISLNSITESVNRLAAAEVQSAFREESKVMAESFKSLTLKAGYTSRVSFDELAKQFTVAADENSAAEFQPGTAKLLAQRSLHLLSAELESTRFSL